jgi:hypothetical protein
MDSGSEWLVGAELLWHEMNGMVVAYVSVVNYGRPMSSEHPSATVSLTAMVAVNFRSLNGIKPA